MATIPTSPTFILYHHRACPFCVSTRTALSHLAVSVEERDIIRNPAYRAELIQGGGKAQVPCLRINSEHGDDWLYESDEIVRYLKRHAANAR